MRRLLVVAALLALVGAADGAPARATQIPGAKTVVTAAWWGSIASDGERYVAVVLPGERLRVFDDAEGTSFDTPIPSGCLPDRRSFVLGAGQLIARCWATPGGFVPAAPPASAQRLDLTTQQWHPIPGSDRWLETDRPDLLTMTAVGSRWVAFEEFTGRRLHWADWHTGAVRDDDGEATDAPDLDGERLFQSMCSPLERPLPQEQRSSLAFMPTTYEAPYALAFHVDFALTLQRCGDPQPTLIGTSLEQGQLGAGFVTWGAQALDPDLSAYLPECRLRISWAVTSSFGTIVHVRDAIYVLFGDSKTQTAHVERVTVPRPCPAAAPQLSVAAQDGGRRIRVAGDWWKGGGSLGGEVMPLRPRRIVPLGKVRGRIVVRTRAAVRTVRWRVDEHGTWKHARRAGTARRAWRLRAPRDGSSHTLDVEVTDRAGAAARYAFRVT